MDDISALDTTRNRVLAVVFLVVGLLAWEGAVVFLEIRRFIVPTPSSVGVALWRGFFEGTYLEHLWVTVLEVALGFAIGCSLGFALGIGVALNRYAAYFCYPYIIMFQSMPKVALVPIIVLWFGLGIASKVVTAALVAFFPMMVNTIAGLNSADEDRINLVRSLGGSKLQVFTMLRLPNSLPFVFAGLEIALVLSLIGTVVAEFLGAERGLGMLMQSMNFMMDTAGAFSILFVLALLGLTLNRLLLATRTRVLFWERIGKAETNFAPLDEGELTKSAAAPVAAKNS
jgi:NitT/TauT family transport system permease protein